MLNFLFRESPVPIWLYDPRTLTFVDANEAMLEKYGYTRRELLAMSVSDIDRSEKGQEGARTSRHKTKRGALLDVQVVSRRSTFEGREVVATIIEARPERPNATGSVQDGRDQYRRLFEDHSAIKFLVDAETDRFIDANEAAVRFYGWSREQLTSMKVLDLDVLSPESFDAPKGRAVNRDLSVFEVRHRLADGTTRDVEVHTAPIEIAGKEVFESIIHDITDRKRAEEALRESEARYRNLFTFLPDPAYVHVDNRLVFANEAMCRLLGADDPSLLVGKSVFEIVHPSFHETARRRLPLTLKGAPVPTTEAKFVRLDGTEVNVEVSAVAVNWQETTGIQVIARDITERKATEAEVRRLNRIYTVLSNINQAIVRVRELNSLFCEACRIAVEDGGFAMAWFGTVNPETQRVEVLSSFGNVGDYVEALNIDLNDEERNKGPVSQSILSGSHAISDDIERDEAMLPWRESASKMGYRSVAVFPIKFRGRVWGLFNLYSDESDFFNADEVRLLDELSMNISFAVEFIREEAERKEAEEALQRNEDLLRSSLEVANVGIFELEHHSRTLYWSPRQREIYGLETDEPMVFEDFLALIHPDDLDRIVSGLKRGHDPAGSGQLTSEFRIVWHDGTVHWVSVRSKTFFSGVGPDRHPVRTVGATLDITERKETEERLRLSDEIIRRVNALILIADGEGNITYASPSVRLLLGYEPEEVLGDGWWHLAHPDDPELHGKELTAAIARRETPLIASAYENETHGKDGKTHWFLWQDARGNKGELISVGQDITGRKQAEEALLRSERKHKDIFESAPLGIFQTTLEGLFTTCNSELARILGYETPEEVIGLDLKDTVCLEPDRCNALVEHIESSGSVGDIEVPWRRKDNTSVWVQLNARAVCDADGTTQGFEGFVSDITERKQAEEKLKENEGKRRELELELVQAQKLESLGTLASGIAHDFNNILGVIMGHAALLEELAADGPIAYKENMDAILRSSARGAALVRQMLTFARKTDVTIESVILNDLVAEVVKFVRQTFSKTIAVEMNLDPSLPSINADPTQVHQILLNLCVNARDAMPEGGTLFLDTSKEEGEALRKAHPRAKEDSYAVVSVRDTGAGMDEQTQRRIFEPFFTTKERGKGTGLGLSIVFGMMQSNEGFVTVSTEPGKGTSFHCHFPVPTGDRVLPEVPLEEPRVIQRGNETILVVEDEELLRGLLVQILSSKGYTVLSEEDAEQAFATYEEHQGNIALVISDLGLPKFGGDELYGKMKRINPNVHFLLSSGYVEPGLKAAFLRDGMKEVLAKPYHPEEVLRVVRRVLDGNPT